MHSGEYVSSEKLIKLAKSVSGKVKNTEDGIPFVLYSGRFPDGKNTVDASHVANAIKEKGKGVTVSQSEAGQLLLMGDYQKALGKALKEEMFPNLENGMLDNEKRNLLKERFNEVVFGMDRDGKQVEGSLWASASERFVKENNGNWIVIAGESMRQDNILVQNEIPALLKKPDDFLINGTRRTTIASLEGATDQINYILNQSMEKSKASNLSPENIDAFLSMTSQEEMFIHADRKQSLNKAVDSLKTPNKTENNAGQQKQEIINAGQALSIEQTVENKPVAPEDKAGPTLGQKLLAQCSKTPPPAQISSQKE